MGRSKTARRQERRANSPSNDAQKRIAAAAVALAKPARDRAALDVTDLALQDDRERGDVLANEWPCTEEQVPMCNMIMYVFQIQMTEVPEEFKTDLSKQQIIYSVLGIMVEQLEEKGFPEELIQAGLQNLMHHHCLSLMENAFKHTGPRVSKTHVNNKMEDILNAAPRELRARATFTQDLERLAGPACPEVVRRCLRAWQDVAEEESIVDHDEECCVVCLDKPPDPNITCDQCKKAAVCKPCSRLMGKAFGAKKECPLCRHPARSTKRGGKC